MVIFVDVEVKLSEQCWESIRPTMLFDLEALSNLFNETLRLVWMCKLVGYLRSYVTSSSPLSRYLIRDKAVIKVRFMVNNDYVANSDVVRCIE